MPETVLVNGNAYSLLRLLGKGKGGYSYLAQMADGQQVVVKQIAELVGVRRETIVNLEKGKYNPSLKLAMDIAKVFHTTVEELFFFDD